MTTLKQFLASVAIAVPVFTTFALAAHSQEITPATQPDCSKVVCTEDGVGQPEPEIIILPAPYVGSED